jgi:hypothetical protein
MRFLLAGVCGIITTVAVAGTPEYTYLRTIDAAPHPDVFRMIDGVADNNGGIYFTDNALDAVYYIGNVLTDNGESTAPGSIMQVAVGAGSRSYGDGPDFNSGFSYQGITFDGTNVYAGGRNGTNLSQFVKFVPNDPTNPTDWTPVVYSVNAELTGPAAVGPGLLVAAHHDNGSLVFLQDTGSALNIIGTVNGPNEGTDRSHNVVYDDVSNRIFVSVTQYAASPPSVGQVTVYTSDGTAGGTTYNAAVNPYVAPVETLHPETLNGIAYQTLGFNSEDQVLLINRTTAIETNGSALIDATQTGPNATSYALMDLADTPQGANTGSVTAGVFGTKDGVKFLVLNAGNSKIQVYTQGSSVSDWTLY